ncbi:MAG: hypothetical protein ACK559_31155, partial [bacterium]
MVDLGGKGHRRGVELLRSAEVAADVHRGHRRVDGLFALARDPRPVDVEPVADSHAVRGFGRTARLRAPVRLTLARKHPHARRKAITRPLAIAIGLSVRSAV